MSTTHRSDGALVPGYHLSGDGGLGVLGSSIPSTGANGPGILYSGLSLPADAGSEFRVVLTSVPAGLTIFVEEDSSFTASAVADGTYVCTYDAYQDGVLYGSSTLTLLWGAVEPPPPPPPPPASATALRFDFPGESLFIRIK